ncbi:response regulator transcription factor [Tabrizicola sp. WMC-M-20]|nr:response regulator transcription factor [Tabrizicola sp. WMC-M-20]
MPALIEKPSPFFAAAREARLVLAYRNRDAALAVLEAAERDRRLASVSLLPLEVHMEVWISVTRLLLLGVPYVPANLSRGAAFPPLDNAAPVDVAPPPAAENEGKPVLTRREMEVLKLAASGMQNKNIAAKLALSEHTVKLHMHHVLSKLGVDNRTGATHWFLGQTRQTPHYLQEL